MPNPSKQQSAEDRQEPSAQLLKAGAAHSKDNGAIVPPASKTQSEAGETSSPQPNSSRSMQLLVEALQALAWKSDAPAAAGVYSRMKKIDPTFSYEVDSFKSFRNLLEEAERNHLVVVERAAGASDLSVRSANKSHMSGAVPLERSTTSLRINHDLWQALLDWDPAARYVFNRIDGRTMKSSTVHEDSEHVLVPSISREEQVLWMQEFAEVQDDDSVKLELKNALEEDIPVRGFSRAIRDLEAAGRRWKRYLKKRVLDRASTWASSEGIPLSAIERSEALTLAEGISSRGSIPTADTADEAAMKARVLEILASLPLSELLRLTIPVEYALKQ